MSFRPTPQVKTIPFTAAAYAQMQADFKRLTQERVEVVKRLQIARDMGDLSENGAYHAAKFELGSVGRQLRDLKHLLSNGKVIATKKNSQTVEFGTTVTVTTGKTTLKFLMVSEYESNPKDHKLAITSPIGQAILNHKVGDVIKVKIPAGEIEYTIVAIE